LMRTTGVEPMVPRMLSWIMMYGRPSVWTSILVGKGRAAKGVRSGAGGWGECAGVPGRIDTLRRAHWKTGLG
jgi:hypothetical protein